MVTTNYKEPDRRCCAIGRKAAKRGYTCLVDLDIVQDKLNMAHRYKMKFHTNEKRDLDFSQRMKMCAKNDKKRALFFRCCNKDVSMRDKIEKTSGMDKSRRTKRIDFVDEGGQSPRKQHQKWG